MAKLIFWDSVVSSKLETQFQHPYKNKILVVLCPDGTGILVIIIAYIKILMYFILYLNIKQQLS